jgi:hypothetical protein
MTGGLRKLVCCMLLLAMVGTASAGFGTLATLDTGPTASGPYHGDRGLLRISGDLEKNNFTLSRCYFPLYNLPAFYVCIMFCKIGGGGNACAPMCEAMLTVCE